MPESLPVRKQIVDAVVQSLRGLSAEVRDDTSLRIEVASAYRRVAEVQAQRGKSSFGLHQEAFDSLTNAEKLLSTVRRVEPENREAALEWFTTESALAGRLFDLGKETESVIKARETADELEKHLGSIAVLNEQEALMGIKVYDATARALLNNQLTREAIHYNELSTKATAARADRLKTPAAKVMTARSFRTLGTAQRYAGELEAALASLQRAESWLDAAGPNKEAKAERTEI